MSFEFAIGDFIQSHLHSGFLDTVMPIITALGDGGAIWIGCSALYFSRNRLWIPATIIAALITFTRLYLYVHYPSDVLAGAMIGTMAGWLGYILTSYIGRKLHGRRSSTICDDG